MAMDAAAENEVDLAAGHLVALLKRNLPDLLLSFNLVGSAVDGDYRPGRSDLDFVAVMRHPPSDDEIEGLSIVHRLYATDPTMPLIDGIWISPDDLSAGPDNARPGPATRDGAFLARAEGNRNPITWFALRDRSRTIMGSLDRSAIWHDAARLASWTRENVDAYWVPWYLRAGRPLSRYGMAMLGGRAVVWGVLGISRMHYTLATGRIASKSEAGSHALASFEQRWHPIIEESLRIRGGETGGHYRNPLRRRRDALEFMAMVIAEIRAMPTSV